MKCRVSILDFDRQDVFSAATPESIAKTSDLWKKDIRKFGPWSRIHDTRFNDVSDSWIWRPQQTGQGPNVFISGSGTSTMDVAWHFIENGQMTVWDSVISVKQSAGRGQRKREWISPVGNIYASWYWPLPALNGPGETSWGSLLPLIAGFIFARVFKDINIPVRIKWPNDLLIKAPDGDRKFGGILVEKRGNHILVGTGININYAPEDRRLREEFAVPATHLAGRGHDMSPLALWIIMVEQGKSLFGNLIENTTPVDFIGMIERQLAWIGEKVQVRKTNSEVFEAVMLGLSADGGLRIKAGGREEVMYSGSIIPL